MPLDVAFRRPPPQLRGLLRPYCGYAERTPGRIVRPEVPHPNITVILGFGPAIELPDLGVRRTAFAAGLHPGPVVTAHDGFQQGVELNLSPPLARMVLGVPPGALASDVVELGDLIGAAGRDLPERLHDAPDWAARFALVDDWLLRRMADAPKPDADVLGTWSRLVATQGRARVADVAADLGWSRRHLSQRFAGEVGVPPKTYARILRLQLARELISQTGGAGLGQIALTAGYYDQAHMNRDFRELAGAPPTQVPFVQDGAVAAA